MPRASSASRAAPGTASSDHVDVPPPRAPRVPHRDGAPHGQRAPQLLTFRSMPEGLVISAGSKRAANVGNRLGSTMRHRIARSLKGRINRAIARRSSSIIESLEVACHAGGRGFESRRSRRLKCLQISTSCCQKRRGAKPRGPNPWPKRFAKRPANGALRPRVCSRSHDLN
jgi:hypothetical protein